MKNKRNIFFLFLFIFIDQLSKYIIRSNGGFYICNKGVAFGIVVPNYLFVLLWSIILFVITAFLISKFKTQSSNQVQGEKTKKFNIWILNFIWNNLDFEIWILILSGAISNMIDRLYFGCVIDFIDLKFLPRSELVWGWPLFNLADAFIVLGAIMLIMKYLKK